MQRKTIYTQVVYWGHFIFVSFMSVALTEIFYRNHIFAFVKILISKRLSTYSALEIFVTLFHTMCHRFFMYFTFVLKNFQSGKQKM